MQVIGVTRRCGSLMFRLHRNTITQRFPPRSCFNVKPWWEKSTYGADLLVGEVKVTLKISKFYYATITRGAVSSTICGVRKRSDMGARLSRRDLQNYSKSMARRI